MTHAIKYLWILCIATLLPIPLNALENPEAWTALREGRAVLMLRHARAPGFGDPAHFEVDDCATQRNLNEEGREQARSWKPFLKEHGIERARVFSSQWCRCLETARKMRMGPVEEMLPLNSFFQNPENKEVQTRQTIELVNALGEGAPIVLVTHQVNVSALASVSPASNEGVIIALPLSDAPTVLARVSPDGGREVW